MKEKIHPEYVKCKVICSCGEVFQTRSTVPEIKIEICSKCHPFYTGKQKFVDSGGRVERFQQKFGSLMEKEKAEEKTEEKVEPEVRSLESSENKEEVEVKNEEQKTEGKSNQSSHSEEQGDEESRDSSVSLQNDKNTEEENPEPTNKENT